MAKILLLLESEEPEQLEDELLGRSTAQLSSPKQATLQLMRALDNDVFYRTDAPFPRPQMVVELISAPGLPLSVHLSNLEALLPGLPYSHSSLALSMQERVYIDSPPQDFYYHYLMLRRSDWCWADYMDYYSNFHCRFGFHTPAIEGYSQNIIDLPASESLAAELGLGFREVTSISELKMPSVDAFLASPAMAELGDPAAEDETRFVDRENSIAFTSEVIWRSGNFESVSEAIFEQYFLNR